MGSLSESVVLSDSDERSSLELQERGTITPSRRMEVNQSSDDEDTEFDSTRLRFSAHKGHRKSGSDEESPSKRPIKLSRGHHQHAKVAEEVAAFHLIQTQTLKGKHLPQANASHVENQKTVISLIGPNSLVQDIRLCQHLGKYLGIC